MAFKNEKLILSPSHTSISLKKIYIMTSGTYLKLKKRPYFTLVSIIMRKSEYIIL